MLPPDLISGDVCLLKVEDAGACSPTWDGWQCWEEEARPGEVKERPCPTYIYFFTHGASNGVGCQSKFSWTIILKV